MKPDRIKYLCHTMQIPNDPEIKSKLTNQMFVKSLAGRLAVGLGSPDFGWRLARHYHESGIWLPADITEWPLRMAFYHLQGHTIDENMRTVIALAASPDFKRENILLRAYLLCEELSPQDVADRLALPIEVVFRYAELFFNVIDRRGERTYIAGIACPGTRIETLRQKEADTLDAERVALQLALDEGAAAVDDFAGMTSDWLEGKPLAPELEARVMTNALRMAVAGFSGVGNNPTMDQALKLLTTRRRRKRPASQKNATLSPQSPPVDQSIRETLGRMAGSRTT